VQQYVANQSDELNLEPTEIINVVRKTNEGVSHSGPIGLTIGLGIYYNSILIMQYFQKYLYPYPSKHKWRNKWLKGLNFSSIPALMILLI